MRERACGASGKAIYDIDPFGQSIRMSAKVPRRLIFFFLRKDRSRHPSL